MERIIEAVTLDEAIKMGIVDRIMDMFRGGVKRAAIRQAFEMVQQFKQQISEGAKCRGSLIVHFAKLRLMVLPEFASHFALNVAVGKVDRTWSYSMSILDRRGQECWKLCEMDLSVDNGLDFIAFKDYELLTGVGDYLSRFGSRHVGEASTLHQLYEAFLQKNIDAIRSDRPVTSVGLLLEKFSEIASNLCALGADPSIDARVDIEYHSSLATLTIGGSDEGLVLAAIPLENLDCLREAFATKVLCGGAKANRVFAASTLLDAVALQVASMVDDEQQRAALSANLHDPFFSQQNFVCFDEVRSDARTRESPPGPFRWMLRLVSREVAESAGGMASVDAAQDQFQAVFRNGMGREERLTFSNVLPSLGEFRGAPLREALEFADYSSIYDLVCRSIGTAVDGRILPWIHACNLADDRRVLGELIEQGKRPFGLADGQDLGELISSVVTSVSSFRVANTSMGALLGGAPTFAEPSDAAWTNRFVESVVAYV
jgi:hypothetical protein